MHDRWDSSFGRVFCLDGVKLKSIYLRPRVTSLRSELPRSYRINLGVLTPGTYTAVKDKPSKKPRGFAILQRAFVDFGACIEAFRHMLPVISVDGTFLIGKYKG